MRMKLSPQYRKVVKRLSINKGAIVSNKALYFAVWGNKEDDDDKKRHEISTLVAKVKRSLPQGALLTHYGLGYSINPEVDLTDFAGDIDDNLIVVEG
jgi:DNA-binding response OmpR family regulator